MLEVGRTYSHVHGHSV